MTAKEMKQAGLVPADPITGVFEDAYVFTTAELHTFCAQLCREQREICRLELMKSEAEVDINIPKNIYLNICKYRKTIDLRNAPMPEL